MKLSRAGLRDPDKQIGSFLFSGPTGVGKTEVARQLALNWGVTATVAEGAVADEAKIARGLAWGCDRGILASGDLIVITAGISREGGSTSSIRVATVP